MDLFTFAVLFGAYEVGKRWGKPKQEAGATGAEPQSQASVQPPRTFPESQLARILESRSPNRFKPEVFDKLCKRFERMSLEPIPETPNGVMFFRLVPYRPGNSALSALTAMQANGFDVYVSISCLLQAGERIVAASHGVMPATWRESPHFASFVKPLPAPKPGPDPEPAKTVRPNGAS